AGRWASRRALRWRTSWEGSPRTRASRSSSWPSRRSRLPTPTSTSCSSGGWRKTTAPLPSPPRHRQAMEDVAAAYQAMDFLLLPSYREGFPNVVLEASSAGRPAIGFRSTGVRDAIIDGGTGQLVPVGDAGALAKAMATYLNDPELAARHGAA